MLITLGIKSQGSGILDFLAQLLSLLSLMPILSRSAQITFPILLQNPTQ